jgi:CheY-like chemotaxis protein
MAGAQKNGIVLVVDDDQGVLEVTAGLFRHLGYDAVTADNGYAALEILRADEQIDLLFADLCMSGMDGDRLVAAARLLRPTLHVIVTSGSARPRQHVPFLAKPYHTADLVAALPPELTARKPVS